MATNVGDVYVRVHADNSRFRNELKAAAHGDGKEYANAFDEALGKEFDKIAARNRQRLANAFATGDFSGFEKEMGSVQGAVRRVNTELDHLIDKSEISHEQAREVSKAVKEWAVPKGFTADIDKTGKSFQKIHQDALAMNRVFRRTGEQVPFSEAFENAHREALKVNRQLRVAEARAKKFGTEANSVRHTFRNMGSILDGIGPKMGKAFGKGARNNFVNLVGTVIGAMVTLFTLPAKMIGPVVEGISSISSAISEMGKNASATSRNVAGLAAALGEMVLSNINPAGLITAAVAVAAVMPVLGAAIAAVFAAMSLAAAAVSVLAGMLLSLASAAAFAISGALLPLVPLILSLAPAIIIVVAAMKQFEDMRKKGWEKKHPGLAALVKQWKEIGKVVQDSVNKIFQELGRLEPLFRDFLKPLIKGTGDAMALIASDFGKIMTTPGMKAFLDVWKVSLPAIFTSLGLALNRVFTGLIAFFTPILPFAQKLADAILLIAQRFTDWAQSAAGQQAITDFMTKAWEAATTLWDIIVRLGSALGTLFSAGQENGQGFLDWLDRLVTRFDEWLKKPEGQQALKQFFEDAKTAAQSAWDLIKQLFEVFDNLDTGTSRAQLDLLIDTVTAVVDVFASIVKVVADMAAAVEPIISALIRGIIASFALLLQGAVVAFGWIPGVGEKLRGAQDKFNTFAVTVNKDLDTIHKTIKITADTAGALTNVKNLNAEMKLIRDKTVGVTVNTHYAITSSGAPPGAKTGKGALAAGDVVTHPRRALIGEAGPEAVVPLNRPLALVDPAVRALSAFAQGKSMAAGGVITGGKTINVSPGAITVNTTQASPVGVAMSVLDRLTAAAV